MAIWPIITVNAVLFPIAVAIQVSTYLLAKPTAVYSDFALFIFAAVGFCAAILSMKIRSGDENHKAGVLLAGFALIVCYYVFNSFYTGIAAEDGILRRMPDGEMVVFNHGDVVRTIETEAEFETLRTGTLRCLGIYSIATFWVALVVLLPCSGYEWELEDESEASHAS